MSWESAVLALSPDSYWKLDEASAGPGAVDEIGAANGTYDGAGITYSEPSLVPTDAGTSVKFDDTVGGAVNISDIYDFAGTTSFTAIFWGKIETFNAGNGHFAISKRTSTGPNGWYFAINAPACTLTAGRVISGTFQEATHTVAEATIEGNSHMYGIQYDGTDISVIYDGALFGTAASAGSLSNHAVALTLGKYSDGGGSTWDGWMDEVAIFTPSLSTQNIADLYTAGLSDAAVARKIQVVRSNMRW